MAFWEEHYFFVRKNPQSTVTNVLVIKITTFEDEQKNIQENPFKIKQMTEFGNELLNQRCVLQTVILSLIDAVF